MHELNVPATVDAGFGFDVQVRVLPAAAVWPDHDDFVTVQLVLEKRVEQELTRVRKNQADVDAAIARMVQALQPQLRRERARRDRAGVLRHTPSD